MSGAELEDELFEHDGEGDMPLVEPVPDGWLPDPDSDDGVVCPGCITDQERREAASDHELIVRGLHGELD